MKLSGCRLKRIRSWRIRKIALTVGPQKRSLWAVPLDGIVSPGDRCQNGQASHKKYFAAGILSLSYACVTVAVNVPS